MAVTLSPYDLPDAFLFNGKTTGILVWQPQEPLIVLGQSNNIEASLFAESVEADRITVTKRPSGGESVILTPSTIAFTVARRFRVMMPFSSFFTMVNNVVTEGLAAMGVREISLKGISDITVGNHKILGSAMRKVNDMLVYHAVLNLAEDPALFSRYLRHPVREPDYRSGRDHESFVTSLHAEGYLFTADEVTAMLNERLGRILTITLPD